MLNVPQILITNAVARTIGPCEPQNVSVDLFFSIPRPSRRLFPITSAVKVMIMMITAWPHSIQVKSFSKKRKKIQKIIFSFFTYFNTQLGKGDVIQLIFFPAHFPHTGTFEQADCSVCVDGRYGRCHSSIVILFGK